MKLVSAMCPNCGAKLELDENIEKGFCMYCGSQILVQDAVQKYKVEISGRISVEGILSAEDLAKNGDTLVNIGNYQQAYDSYNELSVKYPDDYRGWWGMIKAMTSDFTIMPSETDYHETIRNTAAEYFDYAAKVASGSDRKKITEIYEKWDKNYYHQQHIFELRDEYGKCKAAHSGSIGSQIFGGFATVGMFLLVLFLIAVTVILGLLEVIFIVEIFSEGDFFGKVIRIIGAAILLAPTLKVIRYTFFRKLPEFIGVVTATRESARVRVESKLRMREIDREYNDITNK
ncbi:MAG: zinc ribbon domain-containing protein [Oscillospiraceae bacterium]|nr:zinc ribbon domain-containing protein [Oscillospiraceae bacterium]